MDRNAFHKLLAFGVIDVSAVVEAEDDVCAVADLKLDAFLRRKVVFRAIFGAIQHALLTQAAGFGVLAYERIDLKTA